MSSKHCPKYIGTNFSSWKQVNYITVTSHWARWRLKSPASRWFTQPFFQAQIKENIKAPRHWPSVRGIHRWPVNSPHKGSVTRKCFHLMTSSWNGTHDNDNDYESNCIAMIYINHITWYTGNTDWMKIKQAFLWIHLSLHDKRNKSIMYNPSPTIQLLYSKQRGQKACTYGLQYLLTWSRNIGGAEKTNKTRGCKNSLHCRYVVRDLFPSGPISGIFVL